MKRYKFQCAHCDQKFVHESRYMDHECKEMKRDKLLKSPTGQAAWLYYQRWMKAYKRIAPTAKTFLSSRYFLPFIRFAEFIKKVDIPDVDMFIRLMKMKDISPMIWTNDQVYALYIEHMDRTAQPHQQAQITIDTLFKMADTHQCDVSNVFDNIEAHELIDMLRKRKLSPWLLLFSEKFKQFIRTKTTTEERVILEAIIRPSYWREKFKERSKDVAIMKVYVNELNI